MPTQPLLWRISRNLCSQQAWDHVVEPLLADVVFDLARSRTRLARVVALTRWCVAVAQALLLCGLSGAIASLSTRSLDGELVLVGSYAFGIVVVISTGSHWVRTGEISVMSTLQGLSRIVPFLPWGYVAWGTMFGGHPPTGRRAVPRAIARFVLMSCLLAIACWLNPEYWPSIAGMTAVNLALSVFGRRYFARSWESVPEGQRIGEMGNHPSIKG